MSAILTGHVDDHCPGCGTRLGDIPDDPVMIPRAEYKVYRVAAKEWMKDHTNCAEEDRCDCRECEPANKIWDALRAAGIQTEEEDS